MFSLCSTASYILGSFCPNDWGLLLAVCRGTRGFKCYQRFNLGLLCSKNVLRPLNYLPVPVVNFHGDNLYLIMLIFQVSKYLVDKLSSYLENSTGISFITFCKKVKMLKMFVKCGNCLRKNILTGLEREI